MIDLRTILLRAVRDGLNTALGKNRRRSTTARRTTARRRTTRRSSSSTRRSRTTGGYLGDFTGVATISYAPLANAAADPGEVVWTWVPFEEDHSQGKDRPVLVVAEHGPCEVLALMLTSKDHDRDAAQEARYGRVWLDIGTGTWDRERRPSEVRLDRVLRFTADSIRREGAVLERAVFEQVAHALRERHGWS